jgi:poly(A)-specific ribonuclease
MVSAKWTSVTKENFIEILPQVLEAIKTATFIAFDTELTGLQLTRAHRNSNLDDLVTRYGKLRESVSNFGLLQVGLACFKWSESRQKYRISAYSFYVFPSAANGIQQERKFTCQLGSLTFLSEFKFDFNKAFHQGIPFITRREEAIIKSNSVFYQSSSSSTQQSQQQQQPQKPLILLKDEEKAIVNEVFDKIDEWLDSMEEKEDKNSSANGVLDLPVMNSFQRLIFYQQIPLKYGESLAIVKKSTGCLSVKKAALDPESRAAAFQEEKDQFERALDEQIGFRRVIDQVIEAGKPVIGHNCWVDLLHFYQKFVDNNLPPSLSGFKEEVLKCFPVIIDTKYLARLVSIKDSSLGDLTALASTFPEKSFFSSNEGEESSSLFHDAGFDAICTGRVFLCLLAHHLRPKGENEVALNSSLETLLQNQLFYNRLNVLQSDYAHLDLKGIELEPDRSSVLYLYNFAGSSHVSHSDIQSLLQALLKVSHKISCQISWLNEASACFVQFEQAEQANDVLEAFKLHEVTKEEEEESKIDESNDKEKSNEEQVQLLSPKKISLLNNLKIATYRQYQEKRDQLLSQNEESSKKRPRY